MSDPASSAATKANNAGASAATTQTLIVRTKIAPTSLKAKRTPEGAEYRNWSVTLLDGGRLNAAKSASTQLPSEEQLSVLPFVENVEFHLHPTFKTPIVHVKKAPFCIRETGWGEFEMHIIVHFQPSLHTPPLHLRHDLNFSPLTYDVAHAVRLEGAHMAATSDSLEASPASAVGTAAGRPEAPLASMKKRPLEARWEEAMAATKKSRAVSSATADTPHTVVFKEGKAFLEELERMLLSLPETEAYKAAQMIKAGTDKSAWQQESEGLFEFDLFALNKDTLRKLYNFAAERVL